MHFYYHRLCPNCAEEHYNYRFTEVDLTGRNVILTGGRVKVGYATALRVLESGANLTLTTRFPALALENFKKENPKFGYGFKNNWINIYSIKDKERANKIQSYLVKLAELQGSKVVSF